MLLWGFREVIIAVTVWKVFFFIRHFALQLVLTFNYKIILISFCVFYYPCTAHTLGACVHFNYIQLQGIYVDTFHHDNYGGILEAVILCPTEKWNLAKLKKRSGNEMLAKGMMEDGTTRSQLHSNVWAPQIFQCDPRQQDGPPAKYSIN